MNSENRMGRRWWAAIVLIALLAMPAAENAHALKLELTILSTPVTSFRAGRSADSGSVESAIALGAPLYIRLELTNNEAQPVSLLPSVDPASSLVGVFLIGPNGPAHQLRTRRWEIRDLNLKVKSLAPGKSIVHETFLYGVFSDEKERTNLEYLFPSAGSYQLFARYSCPQTTQAVESNRVTVRVGAPIPQWDELLKAGIVDQLEGRSRSQAEGRRRLDSLSAIVAQTPASPLAPMLIPSPGASKAGAAAVSPATEQTIRGVIDQFVGAWEMGDLQFCANVLGDGFLCNAAIDKFGFQQMLSDGLDSLRGRGMQPNILARDIRLSSKGSDVESVFQLVMGTIETGVVSEQAIAIVWRQSGGAWRMWRWNNLEP